MKIAFLVGSDTPSTRLSIEAICNLPDAKSVAILLDTDKSTIFRRIKNIKRNIRRQGFGYVFYRVMDAACEVLERLASKIISQEEVTNLLRKAFPEKCFSLKDIEKKYNIPFYEVGNLNSSMAASILKNVGAEIGVVIGTRILKKSTFAVPSKGCINIHKGKVPEFRGMPPGFWELYEGVNSASITIHFVEDGIDTGDIVGTKEIPIHKNETVVSLRKKLDIEGAKLLSQCVYKIMSGTENRTQQPKINIKSRTNPTRKECLELKRRTPKAISIKNTPYRAIKTLIYLAFYYTKTNRFIRYIKKKNGSCSTCILLYHRVNDYSSDVLTTTIEDFASHLTLIDKYFHPLSTSELYYLINNKKPIPAGTVVIHFDDCYRDVYTNAAPLLYSTNISATAFISSGYIDSNRQFEHDTEEYPFVFENLRSNEVYDLQYKGFEIAAHTVNHCNLGKIEIEQVQTEVNESKIELEKIVGKPIEFFSYPFGKKTDISKNACQIVQHAGFKALFSAYGGVVTNCCDLFDIQRKGANSEYLPLDLLMEIDGISIGDISKKLKKIFG